MDSMKIILRSCAYALTRLMICDLCFRVSVFVSSSKMATSPPSANQDKAHCNSREISSWQEEVSAVEAEGEVEAEAEGEEEVEEEDVVVVVEVEVEVLFVLI